MSCTGLLGPGQHSALTPGDNIQPMPIGCGPTKDKLHHNHQMPNKVIGGGGVGVYGGVAVNHLRGDDGSSGYGSPDSETFETPANQ